MATKKERLRQRMKHDWRYFSMRMMIGLRNRYAKNDQRVRSLFMNTAARVASEIYRRGFEDGQRAARSALRGSESGGK